MSQKDMRKKTLLALLGPALGKAQRPFDPPQQVLLKGLVRPHILTVPKRGIEAAPLAEVMTPSHRVVPFRAVVKSILVHVRLRDIERQEDMGALP